MRPDIAMKYNRRIFPVYKGIGWDPLFYGAIILLFLSEIKEIEVYKIMYAESLYSLFFLIFQVPSTIIIEKIGSRNSLILGCTLVTIQIAMMMLANNMIILMIAYILSALGTALKETAQYTLLFDSTKMCKGKNSFGNLDAKGSSISYVLNAITSILAGYLYLINPYIPIILSTILSSLTIILAYRFEDVQMDIKEKISIKESMKEIKEGFKFIIKSKRLRSLFIFIGLFVGILIMISTYEKSLLKDLNVEPQYFGIIFAIFTIVQCISVQYQDKMHKKFKNETLTFIAIPILFSFIIAGIVCTSNMNNTLKIIITLIAFFIHHFFRAPYWVLENRYITNFTNSDIRAKILSASNLIEGIGRIGFSFLGGVLLEYFTTSQSYIIVGWVGLILILLSLKYMKSRVGLAPEEYDKKDIEYIKMA